MPTGTPDTLSSVADRVDLDLQIHSRAVWPRFAVWIPVDPATAATSPREGSTEKPTEGISLAKE
jgi:hypothetical protein